MQMKTKQDKTLEKSAKERILGSTIEGQAKKETPVGAAKDEW